MVSDDLITFMRGNFGNQCLRVLNELHQKLGVEDIESAGIEEKKNFILEIQGMMKNDSVYKSEIVTSTLMNLLRVNINEPSTSHIGLSESDKMMIAEFVNKNGHNKIRSVLEEMNALVDIYMSKTDVALKQGVSEKSIIERTTKVLEGINKKLKSISKDIEKNFNVKTNVEFIHRRMNELEEKGEFNKLEMVKSQTRLAHHVEAYERSVQERFEKYRNEFTENLKKKIYLDKQKIPSEFITRKTKDSSERYFEDLKRSFLAFKVGLEKSAKKKDF